MAVSMCIGVMLRTELDRPIFEFSDKQQRVNVAFYLSHSTDAMPWQVQKMRTSSTLNGNTIILRLNLCHGITPSNISE